MHICSGGKCKLVGLEVEVESCKYLYFKLCFKLETDHRMSVAMLAQGCFRVGKCLDL